MPSPSKVKTSEKTFTLSHKKSELWWASTLRSLVTWSRVVSCMGTDVSEELLASLFMMVLSLLPWIRLRDTLVSIYRATASHVLEDRNFLKKCLSTGLGTLPPFLPPALLNLSRMCGTHNDAAGGQSWPRHAVNLTLLTYDLNQMHMDISLNSIPRFYEHSFN